MPLRYEAGAHCTWLMPKRETDGIMHCYYYYLFIISILVVVGQWEKLNINIFHDGENVRRLSLVVFSMKLCNFQMDGAWFVCVCC